MSSRSQDLKEAILRSLKEEKQPPAVRFKRASLFLFVLGFSILGAVWAFFWPEINIFWLISFLSWLVFAGLASYFYFQPQPRIVVSGFWTAWMYSKLFFLFLVLSTLQLIICPHLAMLAPSRYFSIDIFESAQELFMSWGGIASCMFFCGFCFASLASGISLGLMRRATLRTPMKDIFKIVGLAGLAQIPIVIIQISDSHLRLYFWLWLLGSLVGVLLIAILVSISVRVLYLFNG